MRATVEIIVAVKEEQPVTDEELKLALLSLSGINHFVNQELRGLADAVLEGKPSVKLKATMARELLSRMFYAIKAPCDEWLGPGNTPGTPEFRQRMAFAKKIFKAATGEEL